MNILITGASGSMGFYLADYIRRIEPGATIFGIGKSNTCERVKGLLEYNPLNLTSCRDSIIRFLDRAQPDIIFHLASLANVTLSFMSPRTSFYNNVIGTVNLYQALAELKIKPTVMLASTSEVYGANASMQPYVAPLNPYAITKCTQEMIARYYRQAENIPFVITRAFGYINPLRSDLVATAIALQMAKAERGELSEIRHGNTSPIRTFCDVRDVARAYWLAATIGKAGDIFDLGSTDPISIYGLILRLKELCKADIVLKADESLMRPTDVTYCVPDISYAQRVLGWQPQILLQESLEWLMECCRERINSE